MGYTFDLDELGEDLEKALSSAQEPDSLGLKFDVTFNTSVEINIETRPIKVSLPNEELVMKEISITKKIKKKSGKCQEII